VLLCIKTCLWLNVSRPLALKLPMMTVGPDSDWAMLLIFRGQMYSQFWRYFDRFGEKLSIYI
jgi:hypothetical protein